MHRFPHRKDIPQYPHQKIVLALLAYRDVRHMPEFLDLKTPGKADCRSEAGSAHRVPSGRPGGKEDHTSEFPIDEKKEKYFVQPVRDGACLYFLGKPGIGQQKRNIKLREVLLCTKKRMAPSVREDPAEILQISYIVFGNLM